MEKLLEYLPTVYQGLMLSLKYTTLGIGILVIVFMIHITLLVRMNPSAPYVMLIHFNRGWRNPISFMINDSNRNKSIVNKSKGSFEFKLNLPELEHSNRYESRHMLYRKLMLENEHYVTDLNVLLDGYLNQELFQISFDELSKKIGENLKAHDTDFNCKETFKIECVVNMNQFKIQMITKDNIDFYLVLNTDKEGKVSIQREGSDVTNEHLEYIKDFYQKVKRNSILSKVLHFNLQVDLAKPEQAFHYLNINGVGFKKSVHSID